MASNFNFNKVILGGRLTADPELKSTQSGVQVTSLSIAVNRRGGKDSEQKTDFINCTAWKERAKFVTDYFRKGSAICIVGSLQVRSWTDKDGGKRSATEVNVDEVMFVDAKGDSAPKNGAQSAGSNVPPLYAPGFTELKDDGDLPF